MAHVHGGSHDHDVGRREIEADAVRHGLVATVAVIGLAALVGLAVWWPRGDLDVDRSVLGFSDRVEATVTASERGPCGGAADPGAADPGTADPATADAGDSPATGRCVTVSARITGGDRAGETTTLETSADFDSPVSRLAPGDEVLLSDAGPEVPPEARYSFVDMRRSLPLAALAAVFAGVVVALGRLRGLLALAGIGLSLGVLVVFIFPALLDGAPPIGVALCGAAVIAFGTLYLAHGVNDRTTVALLGTMASLGLTAALAVTFAAAAELSGLASEEALTLITFAPDLDFRGLLLAAVVLGTLGVLDDVTVTQVSAVWELRRSDPVMGRRQLYAAGIRIGRDHIASTVNTLVLAYSAAALPLLLIYTQSGLGLGGVLTTETVAVEVVQTLVGSIGLVASVPLTTALACLVVTRGSGPGGAGREWHEPGDPSPAYAGVGAPGAGGGVGRGDPWAGGGVGRGDPWAGGGTGRGDPRAGGQSAGPPGAAARPARTRRPRRRPDDDEAFWTNDPW